MRQQGARSRNQQSNKRMSWKAADVREAGTCDRTLWTSTDVQQDAQVVLDMGSTHERCRARVEQEMVDKGDAIKLETSGNQEEIVQEPDVSFFFERKIGEPDTNPGGASSLTADTPKRRESEQGSSAGNENLLAGCIAAVNKLLCDTPTVDLSRDRIALSGKVPFGDLKIGREFVLRNMLNFDGFEVVDEV